MIMAILLESKDHDSSGGMKRDEREERLLLLVVLNDCDGYLIMN